MVTHNPVLNLTAYQLRLCWRIPSALGAPAAG